MNKVPFPNIYIVKRVPEAESKSCVICYKPSSTVLLAENKGDFFYLCPAHLNDHNFSVPIELEEYIEMKSQKMEIEKKIVIIQKDMETNKPYNWTRLALKVGFGSKKESLEDKKEASDNKKKPEDKYKELEKEFTILNTSLNDISDKIALFKFLKYALDKGIYKMRLQNQLKARIALKREQELHSPGFFPSVPNNNLGKLDN